MKKSLLLLSALVVAATVWASGLKPLKPAAQPVPDKYKFEMLQAGPRVVNDAFKAPQRVGTTESMAFHYWNTASVMSQGYTALRIPNQKKDSLIWQMIELPQAKLQKFAGNQLTGMTIYTGCNSGQTANSIVNVTLALTNDLEAEPFYTQTAKLSTTKWGTNKIKFTTPIDIDPTKPLYAGYYFKLTTVQLQAYYIAIDGVPTNNAEGCWVRYTDWDEDASGKFLGLTGPVWNNFAANYGSLMIDLEISGENMPNNEASPYAVYGPDYATVGQSMPLQVVFTNEAANAINNVEVEYSVNGAEPERTTVTLSKPAAFGEMVAATVNVTCPAASIALPIRARVTKVNGVDNPYAGTWVEGTVLAINEGTGFTRNVLLEEGTGTWCGWCPLGYLALEQAALDYTDGSMVLAAVHNNDAMANSASEAIISKYFDGFPQCVFNRQILMGFQQSTSLNQQNIRKYYDLIRSIPGVAKIDLQLVESATPGKLTAKTVTEFCLPSDLGYRVGFELIEDGVGPYNQTNYLSGTAGFGIFSNGSTVSCKYNDVVRNAIDPFGIEGSLPATVEAGTKYTYTTELPMSSIKKLANARVAAFVINEADGSIENVTVMRVSDAAGVEDNVIDSNVRIQPMPGAVAVSGADVTEVYTVSGTRAAFARGEATIALPAGLYIVKADNQIVKVVVK